MNVKKHPYRLATICSQHTYVYLFQAVFVAVGYSVSSHLNLHSQLTFLALIAFFALISYIYVDIHTIKLQKCNKNQESMEE